MIASIWSLVSPGGLASPWVPGWARGIRPVDIWKSKSAGPSPSMDGPWVVPSPAGPWHDEHVSRYSCRPASWSDPCAAAA